MPGEAGGKRAIVDLWRSDGAGFEGPAQGYNNSCVTNNPAGGHPPSCVPGAKGDDWYDGYEDSLLEQEVLSTIAEQLRPVEFKAGEVIITEGDSGDSLYIVDQGSAHATKRGIVEQMTVPPHKCGYRKLGLTEIYLRF